MLSVQGISAQQAMCGSVRHRDAETTLPTAFATFPTNCIAQPRRNLHVAMTINSLSTQYELVVHHTFDVKKKKIQ